MANAFELSDLLAVWEKKRDKKRPVLRTVRQCIKALGGDAAIAAYTKNPDSPEQWRRWGFIPPMCHWRFEKELQRRGYEVHPRVFGEFTPLADGRVAIYSLQGRPSG